MQQLYHEYKPDDHMSRVEAERKYSSIRLNDNGNPRYLSQRFAEIAHQHPSAAADEPKKIAIILAAAPRMYQSILASQQLALGAQCTAENLIQAMEVVYRQNGGGNHGGQNNSNNNNHELAMAAPGNRMKKCWNCNKAGHVSKDCWSPTVFFAFLCPPHSCAPHFSVQGTTLYTNFYVLSPISVKLTRF
jgi:ribosomal protein L27